MSNELTVGQTATFVKNFGVFVKGEQVAVIDESSLAYKVRQPIDLSVEARVETHVPKGGILSMDLVATAVAPVLPTLTPLLDPTVETKLDAPAVPQPGIEFAKSEESILDQLMGGGGGSLEIGGGFTTETEGDSGVKPTEFVKPLSLEEKEKARLLSVLEAKKNADKAYWDNAKASLSPHPDGPKLKEGQFWLSDLTYGVLPASGIDYKITAYSMSEWSDEQQLDIPDVNIYYHWDADCLEAIHVAYVQDEKLLLTGLPGTGKTTAIQQYASHVQQPYMRFNGKDGIEQSSFLGSIWATSKGMEWKDGILPLGMKGGYLVCLDEVFKIPAGIQMALQGLYEKGGSLMLDDKPGDYHEKLIVPESNFRLMLTDNVKGTGDSFEKFSSTQLQDSSSLDRFGITYELDYLPKAQEVKMLLHLFPEMSSKEHTIRTLVKFAGLVRAGYKQGEIALTLSPRGLITTLNLVTDMGMHPDTALQLSFRNKIAEESEQQAIHQMLLAVGNL